MVEEHHLLTGLEVLELPALFLVARVELRGQAETEALLLPRILPVMTVFETLGQAVVLLDIQEQAATAVQVVPLTQELAATAVAVQLVLLPQTDLAVEAVA